jgi:AraC family ethanolamine operon transcriptional activator
MRQRCVETRRITEPDDAIDAVPRTSYRITPLSAGPFEVRVTTIGLGPIALQIGRCTPFVGFATPDPDTAVLQLPLEHLETLVLNGVQAPPRAFATYGSGAELLRANSQAARYAAIVLPSASAEALLEPPTGAALLRPGSHALLSAAPSTWERAARVLEAAERTAAESPATFEADEARRALRDAVLQAARGMLSGTAAGEQPVGMPRASRARRRTVAAADEYLRAHLDRPIYTDELCDALGVSASGLGEAFRAVFVVSPHRFLKLRRLHMVRAALRARGGPAPLVKAVALAHGFWHLGQFAHDYRAAFGEAPSETLARARGRATAEAQGGA